MPKEAKEENPKKTGKKADIITLKSKKAIIEDEIPAEKKTKAKRNKPEESSHNKRVIEDDDEEPPAIKHKLENNQDNEDKYSLIPKKLLSSLSENEVKIVYFMHEVYNPLTCIEKLPFQS